MADKDILKARDKILETLLYYISNNETLNEELIFQGGGALHFIYNSPRYSCDLDFTAPKYPSIRSDLTEILSKDIKNDEVLLFSNLRIDKNNLLRAAYRYDNGNVQNIVGKIEIMHQNAPEYKVAEGKFSPIKIESPEEIYASKIIATLERMGRNSSMKGSDLFDLYYLINSLNVSMEEEKIIQRALDRDIIGKSFNTKTLDRVMGYIINKNNQEQIIKTIKKTMTPDFFSTQKFDKGFFEFCMGLFDQVYSVI